MLEKYTKGIFISFADNSGDSKISRISMVIQGRERYREFHIIRIFKKEELDAHGRVTYDLIKTVEYAYDGLLLINKYCNKDPSPWTLSKDRFPVSAYPDKEEYSFVDNGLEFRFQDDDYNYTAKIKSNYIFLVPSWKILPSRILGAQKFMFVPYVSYF